MAAATQTSFLTQTDFEAQRADLTQSRAELVDRECYLAILRAELAAFHVRYMREVGILYATLDDWNARIAELIASRAGTRDAFHAAEQARAEADESKDAVMSEAASASKTIPSPELKKLYRRVANCVHPDHAKSEADRILGTRLMAEANAALDRGDMLDLERIMAEYETAPHSMPPPSPLEGLLEELDKVRTRLRAVQAEISELTSTELAKLMAKVESQAAQGRDLLKQIHLSLLIRIAEAEKRFEGLACMAI